MHSIRIVLNQIRDAFRVWVDLLKIMLPIIVLVKILQEFDLIRYAAYPLEPIMQLVGLPADMGLTWATAMLSNLYGGMVVYAALIHDTGPLSAAQITVLCTMMLIAHNLPLELKIAQRCGVSLMGQLALRIGAAFVCGMLLHAAFSATGMLQGPSAMAWKPAPEPDGILPWLLSQAHKMGLLFCVILVLMSCMRVLDAIGVNRLLQRLLAPVLRIMGIGAGATTITLIGLTLGIAYGGGLIIHEVRQGTVSPRDCFSSMSLMGLCHALVEDTLIMALMGASTIGTLWARLAFSLVAVSLITRLYDRFRGEPAQPAVNHT